MTLAISILLLGISSARVPVQSLAVQGTGPQEQSAAQSAIPSSSSDTQTNSDPTKQDETGKTPSQNSSQSAKPATAHGGAQKKTTRNKASAKRRTHKKKVMATGCDTPSPSSASSASSTSSPAGQSGQQALTNPSNAVTSSTSTSAPSKDCPPAITVVRHGGTKEPSIQLAGGPGGDAASQKRNATNQMLGSTEANLKKISGIQLDQAQQDTVTQIRQFVDQSKAALAAGDLERGQTLAWKAQLLSEDLLKPQK